MLITDQDLGLCSAQYRGDLAGARSRPDADDLSAAAVYRDE